MDDRFILDQVLDIEKLMGRGQSLYEEGRRSEGRQKILMAWEKIKPLYEQAGDELFFKCSGSLSWEGKLTVFLFVPELNRDAFNDEQLLEPYLQSCREVVDIFGRGTNKRRDYLSTLAILYICANRPQDSDSIYEALLNADPTWGGGYLSWAALYANHPEGRNKAIAILKQGLDQPTLENDNEDRASLLYDLKRLCAKTGDKEGAQAYSTRYRELQPTLPKDSPHFRPTPVRHEKKIGRNALCPCGSGKKYKNCCGA